jgi:hypothetical protein
MIDFDPDRIRERLCEVGEEWAELDAAANLLEETKKTVLAELMQTHRSDGVTSHAQCEALALADPAYRLHLAKMVAARKDANKAKVRYDTGKMWAELRRSQESTRRAEMGMR